MTNCHIPEDQNLHLIHCHTQSTGFTWQSNLHTYQLKIHTHLTPSRYALSKKLSTFFWHRIYSTKNNGYVMFICSWSYFNSKSTSITSYSTVLFQKSELTQLVKKFASSYEAQRLQYCFQKNPLQDTILSIWPKLPQICVYNQHILSFPLLHHPPKPDLVNQSMEAEQSIGKKL